MLWSSAKDCQMIICFDCPSATRDELDQLVAKGSYRDYGEVIVAAVRNQALMEQEVAQTGPIVMNRSSLQQKLTSPDAAVPYMPVMGEPGPTAALSAPSPGPGAKRKETDVPEDSITSDASHTAAVARSAGYPAVPDLFTLQGFPPEPPNGLVRLPADKLGPGQHVLLDHWVLGQYNRLLPAKVNARALIRLFVEEHPKGFPVLEIRETANRVAEEAAKLGDYLAMLDKSGERSRDDALATAFPRTTGERAHKGKSRYARQFVVYRDGEGKLSGLMWDLKLVTVVTTKQDDKLIVPTRVAWEFARLKNPVLDSSVSDTTQKFSLTEQKILLDHIITSVPNEVFAFRAILQAVASQKKSPEKIDKALKAHVDDSRPQQLSKSFFASQRTGAVSRMNDLGLIVRQRDKDDGVSVKYVLTKQGREFLKQCSPPGAAPK
jgi:Arc/MetJ-type ribon-helix-helix transcriptional regulator